ncbi:MAG: type II toxin-antitoxin system prevent-host-death family antitoxin [Deltaproteobacteria bacterium]|nr:type II toxin-antitoxin system prevent-host-death family antitoxin [Deltaproteobacteria bacterium]
MTHNVTFSELRNNARKYFDAVERGESLEVYRNGKPIAIVSPVSNKSLARWKISQPRRVRGASLSAAIVRERAE